MFGLDWWILLGATVLFNLMWPPITLAITLYWGIRSTNKTLSKASAIEKDVKGAIHKLEEDAKTENLVADLMEAQAKEMKQMLDGFRGDIIKKVENEVKDAKQQMQQQAQSNGKLDVNSIISAGMSSMFGGN